jgi:hypothetical protein
MALTQSVQKASLKVTTSGENSAIFLFLLLKANGFKKSGAFEFIQPSLNRCDTSSKPTSNQKKRRFSVLELLTVCLN